MVDPSGPVAGRIVLDSPAALGRELKWWLRHGPSGPVKVSAAAARIEVSASTLYAYLAGTTVPPSTALDELLLALAVPAEDHRRIATARDALAEAGRRVDGRVPQELPPATRGFVGREHEWARLDAALAAARDADGPPLVVVSGAAGIGKSALAIGWGQARRDDFPDGRLYADLRGFSPLEPRAVGDVAGALLRCLGEAPGSVPSAPDERAARVRGLLAERRALVVLDNALDAEQVSPLLPGDGTAFCLVTSRHGLDALLVQPGAEMLTLGPLPPDASFALLDLAVADAGLDAADRQVLAERCGGLPLALRIVAARIATEGAAPVVSDLTASWGLDDLDLGDARTSVRAVFSWSESRLPAAEAAAFVRLGTSPLAEVDERTASALWGVSARRARRTLDRLSRVHLMERHGGGRFGLHDLVAEHAAERAEAEMSAAEREQALADLIDGVLDELDEGRLDPEQRAEEHEVSQGERAHARVAARWQDLFALVEHCRRQERWDDTIRLADAMRPHLDVGARYQESLQVLALGLEAARALDDAGREVRLRRHLGVVQMRLGDHPGSAENLQAALDLARRRGVDLECAAVLNDLGNLRLRVGEHERALACYAEALDLAQEAGFRPGEATLLTNLAFAAAEAGDLVEAEALGERALALFEDLDDAPGRARTLGNLAVVHVRSGRPDRARSRLTQALSSARGMDATAIETEVLDAFGELELSLGNWAEARARFERAHANAVGAGDLYEQAVALTGLGEALAGLGEVVEAETVRAAAEAGFRRLGLSERAERVGRSGPSGPSGPSGSESPLQR